MEAGRILNAISFYRVSRWLYLHRIPLLPRLMSGVIFFVFNSYIPPEAEIGSGTKCAYKGMGVVLHARTRIGANCIISQQVTVGGRSKHHDVPVIGDNVYLGAGAKILGPITLGNDVVVGANAVVLENVPDNCAVAGVPAKIVRTGIRMRDLV